jgi:hypothetical protein
MKARIAFLVVAAALLGACGPGAYRPKASEEVYGTWVSDKAAQHKLVIAAGQFRNFSLPDDVDPFTAGTEVIAAKWTDPQGDLWYKTNVTVTSGLGAPTGTMWQTLRRLSKSATVLEGVVVPVRQFDPSAFPAKLEPGSGSYAVYHRSPGEASPRRLLLGDGYGPGEQAGSPRRMLQGDRWQ